MLLPTARTARVDILVEGSLTSTGGGVRSSCTLIRDGAVIVVVDPGMAESARSILDPLRALGVRPEDVTDVVLGHHHPDHTIHAGHFPNAAIHDHWAIYRGIDWEDSECDGRALSPSIVLARTPGHTAEDLATIVGTPDGIVICTHCWFNDSTTVDDEDPDDADALHASRAMLKEVASRIVPGHGAAFTPTESTAV